MPISVLYIHHYGAFGGASRSLLEMIRGFPENSVQACLITPRGSVIDAFAGSGVRILDAAGIAKFDHTRYSHYHGKRWLLLLREIAYLPSTVLVLLRARRALPGLQLIHVNELGALPAILLARAILGRPVIVHVRSVQETLAGPLRRRLIAWVLRRHADAVIAIDETVRRSLPSGTGCAVVYNAYSPRPAVAGAAAPLPPRRPGTLRVAMVGSLLALKGVRELLEAARLCRDRGLPVEFAIIGANTRKLGGITGRLLRASGLAHDVEEGEVRRFLADNTLESVVRLYGFTPDIDAVYANIDVLCFPSHLDAPGRPVFEAAHWRVPSIVALSEALPDTLVEGRTGLRVEARNPVAIADAIEFFCRRPEELKRMGEAAHELASLNFDARRNAARVLDIYRHAIERANRNNGEDK